MKLINKERVMFIALMLVALGYGIFVTFKVLENKTIMLVPTEKIENVENCIDNNVACSLIYESAEEIPN